MKIIHCADIHLDSKMNTNLSKEKAKERKAELLSTFQRMVDYAEAQRVEAIIIAGDLFDTKNVSVTARNLVRDLILAHPDIKFLYLQGNHDEGSFVAGLKEIPENLLLFGDSWVSYPLGERIVVTGIELNQENAGTAYHALSLDAEKINLVVLHGQDAEYQAKDKAEIIHLTGLKNKGIDYLALGHIHSYKTGRLDTRGTYCYPGCLEGRGFDECGEHGFVLLDIAEKEGKLTDTFVPFAYRNLYRIPVDITDCISTMEILERMKQQAETLGYPDSSLVAFELTGSVDVEGEKDVDFLGRQFEKRFYAVKVKDASHYRIDYTEFARDESLKGEFIRTVQAQTDLSEEEKAAIIHYGIQALAGEEILEA